MTCTSPTEPAAICATSSGERRKVRPNDLAQRQRPQKAGCASTAAVNGIEAFPVEVEVSAGYGDTKIIIVGLPDAAVRESQDRVTTALLTDGLNFPHMTGALSWKPLLRKLLWAKVKSN